jgi:DNA-binding GntR family transcriptional regulator
MEKESAIPFYLQIAETIRSRILEGYYTPGDLIPSYQELEKEFNVSNITIRKAIEILVRDGIINRKRGVGTIVAEIDSEIITFELNGNLQRLRNSAEKIPLTIDVLEITTAFCPRRIQEILSVDPTKKIWRMKKIRKHRDVIMSYYIHYSDPCWCGKITKNEAERKRFADLFREKSGIHLIRLEQRVEAAVANLDLSAVLKVNFGAPLLFVENIYYSTQDKPVVLTHIYYRGDRHFYKATAQL